MNKQHLTFFSKKRIYLAVFIGLIISVFLVYSEFSKSNFKENFSNLTFTTNAFWFITLAMFLMGLRDLGYVIRLKLLTEDNLTWKQALRIILIWEFASAVSPGVVGGSAVAIFILKKEKINLGKSSAIVILTTLFDNLFYVLAIPIIIFNVNINQLLPTSLQGYLNTFWIGYSIILSITVTLFISIFVKPHLIEKLLLLFCKLPFLKKYQKKLMQYSLDIVTASLTFKNKPILFWLKIALSTILSWVSRFLVVNSILMAFIYLSLQSNLLVFAKQLVMWLILLVSPTPGGSGVAEYLFDTFLGEYLPNGTVIIAFLWRLITYYPYLFIGAFVIPKWIKK